jgi:hypothetical protein
MVLMGPQAVPEGVRTWPLAQLWPRSWRPAVKRFLRWVDPNRLGEPLEPRRPVDEALGPFKVGGHANAVPLGEDLVGLAVVDHCLLEPGTAQAPKGRGEG